MLRLSDFKITLADLVKHGVPIDWRTIQRGVTGFTNPTATIRRCSLDLQEIKDYALEALADAVGTPDEDPIFQLADADVTRWDGCEYPLETLADRSGISTEMAVRKWRYISLKPFIEAIQDDDIPEYDRKYPKDLIVWTLELWDLKHLSDYWNTVVSVNPVLTLDRERTVSELVFDEVPRIRQWLSNERTHLLSPAAYASGDAQ